MEFMVSICCITYNQEDYISDALESFLAQKTDFKFEILIHDDSSTDNTANIIREYEEKYPEIINPIYQTKNQYSLGIKINFVHNYSRAKGKYIALCEGDDYWIDPFKLQKQVDYMEKNPSCTLCVHAAKKINDNKRVIGYIKPSNRSTYFTPDEVIMGGGGMFATNSMLFPRKIIQDMPSFYFNAPIGDYPLTIFLSLKGNIFYMNDFMSVYRVSAKNSWTSSMQKAPKKIVEHNNRIEKMLNEIDEYTNYKYTEVIKKHILENEFCIHLSNYDLEIIKTGKFAILYRKLRMVQKIKLYVKSLLHLLCNYSAH